MSGTKISTMEKKGGQSRGEIFTAVGRAVKGEQVVAVDVLVRRQGLEYIVTIGTAGYGQDIEKQPVLDDPDTFSAPPFFPAGDIPTIGDREIEDCVTRLLDPEATSDEVFLQYAVLQQKPDDSSQ